MDLLVKILMSVPLAKQTATRMQFVLTKSDPIIVNATVVMRVMVSTASTSMNVQNLCL